MLRTKRACHAFGVTNRTGRRYAGIGAAEQILHEDFLLVQVRADIRMQAVERLRVHAAILLPPDLPARLRLVHQELVLGRAPGVG
jgi:hypothetical protein